jgi:filamentous hemagglutinin family protein
MELLRKSKIISNFLIAFLIWLIGGWPTIVFALPSGGQIVSGNGTIVETSDTQLDINQNSSQLIATFNHFNTTVNETVNVNQQYTSDTFLAKVLGTDPTLFLGKLNAKGQVFITNGSGVFFGPGSQIDVHGLVATTMDISNQDFIDRNYQFTQNLDNPLSSVINEGVISATSYVGLLAPAVENRGTVVTASLGSIDLAAGTAATMDFTGDGLIQFEVTQAVSGTVTDKDGNELKDRVSNTGLLHADGGQIRMTAKDAGDVIRHVVNMEGVIEANTVDEEDGWVILGGGDSGIVNVSGTIDASGDDAGEAGGEISVTGKTLFSSGTLNVEGQTDGGKVNLDAEVIINSGSIKANGNEGNGGNVEIGFTRNYQAMEASIISANGTGGNGGSILIDGGSVGRLFTSGSHTTTSSGGIGGSLELFGNEVLLVAARLDASGDNGGGAINIGGDYQGQGTVTLSSYTKVTTSTTIISDARINGDGGQVVVWSDGETDFSGNIYARGGSISGDGGLIEVSGKDNLLMGGKVSASAANGAMGELLLDPKNITVDDSTGGFPSFDLVDPNADGTNYGDTVVSLSNGNIVVVDEMDSAVVATGGAVYLYNGSTGALINTITGTTLDDQVGSGGVVDLTNGNFVVRSPKWNNGGTLDVGAVTVVSGSLGTAVTGGGSTVSTTNSLYGLTASDAVGNSSLTVLADDNFIVVSNLWDNNATTTVNVGAVTLVSGTTGQTVAGNSFTVTTTNSLHSIRANTNVGGSSVTELANGNIVVASQNWDVSTNSVGAVTLISGTTGRAVANNLFEVSTANSLTGTQASDLVGSSDVVELANGNFVVHSPNWDNGSTVNSSAVTLVSGTTGRAVANSSFVVSTSNSLHGTQTSDAVGNGEIVALANGNFVVGSQNWDNGSTVNSGAVTLVSGTTGRAVIDSLFAVSTANSLHGTTTSDIVGSKITVLANDNYVVLSQSWNDGATTDVGAVTLVNGSGANAGKAVADNLLVVSTTNSFHGTTSGDKVGRGNTTEELSNGNYIVRSDQWNNGATTDVGAVTLINGATGRALVDSSFNISTSNSLHGTTIGDTVGSDVTVLANDNFVVGSQSWDNGGIINAGAVTLVSGTTGKAVTDDSFIVSSANSLHGTTTSDFVGTSITELTSGNYVVRNSNWSNGGLTTAGAITLVNGTTGKAVGDNSFIVSTSNSVVGTSSGAATTVIAIDTTNNTFAAQFKDNTTNRVRIGFTDADLAFANAGSNSATITSGFITSTLNAGTAVTLQASNDITINSDIIVNNGSGDGGDLSLEAGRSILINADITTDNGNFTAIANDLLANGVVDADRDAGDAEITMAAGTTIDAGTGDITMEIRDGTGKTNLGKGVITTETLTSSGTVTLNGVVQVTASTTNTEEQAQVDQGTNSTFLNDFSTPVESGC